VTAPSLLPAAAAAARLGVKPATLYAYVSRGLLRAHRLPGRRGSWFDPVQLDALGTRSRAPGERRPDLRITSRLTLVERGRYWYRGREPVALAASWPFEQVAEFLWNGASTGVHPAWTAEAAAVDGARRVIGAVPAGATPTDVLRIAVAVLGVADPLRVDLRPSGAIATARRLMASTLAAVSGRRRGPAAAQVAAWVGAPRDAATIAAIDDVLVLMADHELAASTVAVRVAASFGADPYAAVAAGLGAMSGRRHGAASRQSETALASMARRAPAPRAAAGLLTGETATPGFGHPLYPDGDPRVPPILALARRLGSVRHAEALGDVLRAQSNAHPNVDFALAAFTHALGLALGSGEALFAAARLAGWLAHALEEYAERTDMRLRAVYTGERPD
jgi:citrate synthase